MKKFLHRSLLSAVVLLSACASTSKIPPNTLSAMEKKMGWRLLFDGQSLDGWRSYRKPDAPRKGWIVENGILKVVAHGDGGDIITTNKFLNFDLRWEWKIPAGANNGVKYQVLEERPKTPGLEYQMLDDAMDAAPGHEKLGTAALYYIFAPIKTRPLNPVGQWNSSRILADGNHVEHWLNGVKVLEYELGGDAIKAAMAESKFKNVKDFGEKTPGHIMLTYHNDEASFRNLKIRELKK
ncbi:MAG: DUF1080 domain-containing protein [Verrucomicrobiota bacterium]